MVLLPGSRGSAAGAVLRFPPSAAPLPRSLGRAYRPPSSTTAGSSRDAGDEELRALAAALRELLLGGRQPSSAGGAAAPVPTEPAPEAGSGGQHHEASSGSARPAGERFVVHGGVHIHLGSSAAASGVPPPGPRAAPSGAAGAATRAKARGAAAHAAWRSEGAPAAAAAAAGASAPEGLLVVRPGGNIPAGVALDGRSYAVWKTPGSGRDLVGVHIGAGCWHRISACLQNSQYTTGRDQLRGSWGLDGAVAEYKRDSARWRVAAEPTIFVWQ